MVSNSQVIVEHFRGEFEAKGEKMKSYLSKVEDMHSSFKKLCIMKIPREENEKANRLARRASATNDNMEETEEPDSITAFYSRGSLNLVN
jgi:hypothetical protein